MRYAYVSGITTDSFVPGVINMFSSLDEKCTDKSIDRICMITENISQSFRMELEKRNIKCINMDSINCSGNGRWTSTFSKLNIYNLVEYDKIVWVDADMMVVNNLDELFNHPHMSAVRTRAPYRYDHNNTPIYSFNSGLMVVVPNKDEFEGIIDSIDNVLTLYKNRGISKIGDQNVLNEYYSDWWKHAELHLNDGYNVFWGSIEQYVDRGWQVDSVGEKQLKVIHYTGRHKPWFRSAWFWIKTWIRSIRYSHRFPSTITRGLISDYCNIKKQNLRGDV